tara:strand:+ start:26130 stop:26351 length:222 start_codon:yes stop_codon:yes gene_type:complete
MDINKFKSVAVRKPDYDILKALCNAKFRSPASMISKMIHEYVDIRAKKTKQPTDKYINKLLKTNGKPGRSRDE